MKKSIVNRGLIVCGMVACALMPLLGLAVTTPTIDPLTYTIGAAPKSVLMSFVDGPDSRGFAWMTDTTVSETKLWVISGTHTSSESALFDAATPVEGTYTDRTQGSTVRCHRVQKSSLADGDYSYRVGGGGNYVYGTFTVDTTDRTLSVLYVGDAQVKKKDTFQLWENTLERAAAIQTPANTDLIISGGDVFNLDTYTCNYWEWGLTTDLATPYYPGVVWSLASGNHDPDRNGYTYYADLTAVNYQSPNCHSYDYGAAHFVILPFIAPTGSSQDASVYSNVAAWAEADLKAANAAGRTKWNIVMIHWGPYTTGDHGIDSTTMDLVKLVCPIFSSNRVDLVLQAHDHTFSKTLPYKWNTVGYTTSCTDTTIINTTPATTTIDDKTYDLNPEGTYYVCTGCSGPRIYEGDGEYAVADESNPKSYVHRTYKVATGKLAVTSTYGMTGDDASSELKATMFGVLKVSDTTLTYDWYAVNTNGLESAVLYDTLRIAKPAAAKQTGAMVSVNGSWCSLGTSITWYNDHVAYDRFTRGYQTCVQRTLAFTNFTNCGQNGGRVQEQFGHVAWADYYTIEHGINDFGVIRDSGKARDCTPIGTLDDYKNNTQNGTFYANYRQLIDEVRATNANAKIILCTPRRGYDFEGYLPSGSDQPQSSLSGDRVVYLTNYVDAVRAIANYEGFVVADLYANAGSNDTVIAENSIDHALHPNDAGYRLIANEVLKAFGKVLDMEITPTYTLERWVSPSGDDTADGLTAATAWRTPQKAVDFFGTGEGTVRLASGTFEGAQPLLNVTNVISVIGAGRTATFLKPDNSATAATVIVGDNVTLQGVCVTNNTTGCGVRRIVGTLPAGVANYAYLVAPKILDCTLTANEGGFACDSCNAYSTLQRCRIVNNNGVGVKFPYTSFGAIRNCLIAGNVCADSSLSGGVYLGNKSRETSIEYCTIVGNTSPVCGGLRVETVGGSAMGYRARLRNSIVCGNRCADASTTPNIQPLSESCTNANCCLTSADVTAIGATYCTDCVTGETAFKNPGAGDYRLQATSCCRDAGYDISGSDASTTDVDGNGRVYGSAPDIGCCERQAVTESECAAFGLPADYSFSAGTTLALTASITPAEGASAADYDIAWSLVSELTGATVATGTASTFTPTVTTSGKHTVILTITNRNNPADTATQTITDAFYTRPSVVYVKSPESGHTGAAWPYDSWDNAATNIIEAMTNVVTGGKVILGEGRHAYDAPYDWNKSYTKTYLLIDRDITIMGGVPNRAAKIVTTMYWGHLVELNSSGAVLSNLTVTSYTRGGTACALLVSSKGGTVVDCDFANTHLSGYAGETAVTLSSDNARLSRCRFIGNYDDFYQSGDASKCMLLMGGGIVENCLFAANTNGYATVRVNSTTARLINCTFVSNTTRNASGNVRFNKSPAANVLLNCILGKVVTDAGADTAVTWSNSSITLSKLEAGVSNCCFEVGTTLGANPVTGDPGFADAANGDWSLDENSSCVDAGMTTADVGTLDLAENDRIRGTSVDIGCYEYQSAAPDPTTVTIAKPTAASGLVYTAAEQTGVTYDSRLTVSGTTKATAKGDYSATFTLPADTSLVIYKWTDETTAPVAVDWSIAARSVTDAGVTFGEIADQTYTGSAIEPSVTMSYAGVARTLGTDFTVAYSDNTAVGTATATVTGAGNFTGEKALSFNIVAAEPEPVVVVPPSAAAYVQSGLVFELDGIENVGLGEHDDAPSALVDLVGGKTVTLNATEIAGTTSNSFYLAPATSMYTVKNVFSGRPTAVTMEVSMKMKTVPSDSNYRAVLHVANGSASVGCNSSGMMISYYNSSMKLFNSFPHPCGETMTTIKSDSAPFYRYVEVASDSMNLPTLYVNLTNSVTPTSSYNPGWTVDNNIYLGNAFAKAQVRAMRVYTRVLTDAERAQNDAIDRMRFEAATSNDTGYAWFDSALHVRLNVAADANGTVQVTGASFGESWPAQGSSVTLTPMPSAGADFLRWEGDTNDLEVASGGVITFAPDVPRSLTCIFQAALPVATSGISAKAYVQDGLVAQWDGVENLSYGQRYADIRAFGWVDLIGGCTLTTNIGASGSITTKANGISLLNATLRAYDANGKATTLANVLRQAPRTIEIAGANPLSSAASTQFSVVNAQTLTADKGVFLWNVEEVSGAYKSVFRVAASGALASSAGNDLGFVADADFTRAVAFSGLGAGSCYTNGISEGALSFSGTPAEFGAMTEAGITLGASAYAALPTDATSPIEYHAVRVYSRQLSAAELHRNRAFDRMRFEGETTNDTGYAWIDEALKIRFKATTTQWGATVTINGEGTDQTAEIWRSPDGSVEMTFVATVPSGFVFKKWVGETDGLAEADLAKTTVTVTADRARALEATYENAGPSGPQVRTWTGTAGDGLWSNPFNWATEGGYVGAPSDDDDIVIPSGFTVTCDESTAALKSLAIGGTLKQKNWDTCVSAETITISNKAVVTCVGPFTDGAMSNRVYLACTDLDIRSGGKIDVSELGYCLTNGPCWTGISSKGSKGGSYGGLSSDGGTHCYGSAAEPTDPGSGGGFWNAPAITSGCGGGAVRIAATGCVTVNGAIRANGGATSSWSQAGGSGGGIYISCRTIAGSGRISANAVNTYNNNTTQPSGGGGRIAVRYDAAAQTAASCSIRFQALGGVNNISGSPNRVDGGAPGSLWFTDEQFLTNATYAALGWRFNGEWYSGSGATKLVITNDVVMDRCGVVFMPPLAEVDFQRNLTVTGNYAYVTAESSYQGGSETCRAGGKGVNFHVGGNLYANGSRIVIEGGRLGVDGNMTLGNPTGAGWLNGAELYLTAAPTNGQTGAWGAEISVGKTLSFNISSLSYVECSATNGAIPRIAARNIYVNTGATVSADARGWAGKCGPGDGYFGNGETSNYAASHGGFGGRKYSWQARPALYGSEKYPLEPGSGARNSSGNSNNRGGGVIYLDAQRRMLLNGTITAAGGTASYAVSGGSGGSILLNTDILMPSTGTISANGGGMGSGTSNYYLRGGGGRVAIRAQRGSTNGLAAVTALAGSGTQEQEQTDGTVFWHLQRPMCLIVR